MYVNIMATVIVRMRTCDKVHKITVKETGDGDYEVTIVSDCPKVVAYGKRLGRITLEDIVEFNGSRIISKDVRLDMSSNCLSPMGVFNAGWIEAGMLSKNLARKSRANEVSFVDDDRVITE